MPSSRLKQVVLILLQLFFGVISCTFFTSFVILSVPIYIFRLLVIPAAKYFRPDLGEILNPISSILVSDLFSGKPPRSNVVITGVIKGHVSIQEAEETVLRTWINATDKKTGNLIYKKFQQYPYRWLGFTFWKTESKFKLQDHLHFPKTNSVVSDKELVDFTQRKLNEPFTPKKSPWDGYLFHNYKNPKLANENQEMTVFLLKFHHSFGDGYSMLSALVEGILEFPLDNVKMPEPQFPKRTFWQEIVYWLTVPFTTFYEMSYTLSNTFRDCPWKIPDRKKAWKQIVGKSDLIPIQAIKDIKNAYGVGFTSVILSVISAAICDHFESLKKKTSKKHGMRDRNMFFLTPLPLPRHPGHRRMLTNHMTLAVFDLPTGQFSTCGERLLVCHSMLEDTKKTVIPLLALIFFYTCGSHLNSIIDLIVKTLQKNLVSSGLTCFPSLPINLEREGRTGLAADFAVGCQQGNAGAAFGVLSFDKNIRFTVTAEEAVMNNQQVERLIQCITEEIGRLHASIGGHV